MASAGASFVAVASASAGEDFATDFQVAAALSQCADATLAGLQLAPLLGPYAPRLRAEDLVHPGPQRRGAGLAHHAHHGETLEVIAVPRSTSEAALCHHGVADRGLPGADSSAVQISPRATLSFVSGVELWRYVGQLVEARLARWRHDLSCHPAHAVSVKDARPIAAESVWMRLVAGIPQPVTAVYLDDRTFVTRADVPAHHFLGDLVDLARPALAEGWSPQVDTTFKMLIASIAGLSCRVGCDLMVHFAVCFGAAASVWNFNRVLLLVFGHFADDLNGVEDERSPTRPAPPPHGATDM
ncbi:unnamed protein product [Symbiodinium necroappetens]|uniref:Uncharacterized protein n=1 Tax=Symbiodinium necroappetens TaxID=1628268 RepID=A0A812IMK6_9DINO|nr:unnamed protein product [Symbiodinium necroappetens]